jgi:hypothetical protein
MVTVVSLVFFARSAWFHAGPVPGLPLDDAWIHLRFAMNVAAGQGLSFNPGVPSAGATAPLWVLALAMLQFLPGGMASQASILSAVTFVASTISTAFLVLVLASRMQFGNWKTLCAAASISAGCAVALCGRFAWSGWSGMEVGLAATLQLLSMIVFVAGGDESGPRRPVTAALLAGLAVLVRPEAVLFLLIVLGIGSIVDLNRGRRLRPILMVVVGFIPVLPWGLYCIALTGRPLPATFGPNKGGLGLPDTAYLTAAGRQLFMDNPVAMILMLIGCFSLVVAAVKLRDLRVLLPALWLFCFPLAASIVAPNLRHHGRYTMPLVPVIAVLAAIGVIYLAGPVLAARGRSALKLRPYAAGALLLAIVIGPLPSLPRWVSIYGRDVQNIQQQHVEVGRWLGEYGGANCHVATHDIGAIAVFSGCQVTDLIGLVSPTMAKLYVDLPEPGPRDVEIRRLLGETGVTHVAVYPTWFPSLARDPALTEVHAVRLTRVSSAGSGLMLVYRTPGPDPW